MGLPSAAPDHGQWALLPAPSSKLPSWSPCPQASLQAKGKATYLTHSTNAKFSKTPGKIGRAPDLGEHDSAVTAQLGLRE